MRDLRDAERARGVDVGQRPLLEHRAPDDAGIGRREEDDQHEDGGPVAAADHADDHDRDQRSRQREHEIDPAHDRPSHAGRRDSRREGRAGSRSRRRRRRPRPGRPAPSGRRRSRATARRGRAGRFPPVLRRRRRLAERQLLGEGRIAARSTAEDRAGDDRRHDQHGDEDAGRHSAAAVASRRRWLQRS